MAEKKLVDYQAEEGVALITLDHPPANTYSYEMMRQLDAAVLEARMDDAVHVLVLTGAGHRGPGGAPPKAEFFSAGADIQMLGAVTPSFKYAFCLHANETLLRLEHTPKLCIAALNGHCVGGGLEIALACDLRVARRAAGKIGLPEVNLGVLPGTGGTQRLARLLGKAKSIELMTQGDLLTLDEAMSLGLINRILDDEDFLVGALAYARSFCPPAKAALAVGRIKRAVQSGAEVSLEAGLALERELQQQLFASVDAAEGISAYNERRKPQFKGK